MLLLSLQCVKETLRQLVTETKQEEIYSCTVQDSIISSPRVSEILVESVSHQSRCRYSLS